MRRKVVLAEITQVESTFPLASAYLHNYARRHAASASEYDLVIRPFHVSAPLERVLDALRAEDAELYTFSCYCWNMKSIRRLQAGLREALPHASILLGGPQVLTCAERYIQPNESRVFVCNGEGEISFRDFLDVHASSQPDYSQVPGISFFRDGQLQTTAPPPQVDLESIPSPFLSSPFAPDTYFVHYLWETNRGCPFHCTFCLWGQLQDSISQFDIERLKEELTWMARRHYVSMHICDANWGMLARDLELVEHIARCKRDFGVPFIIGASHIKNQPERVLRMTELLTEVGIRANTANALQSLNEGTLETIKRRNTSEGKLVQFQQSMADRGFGAIAEIIWPLPDETLETLAQGFASMARMRIGSVLCYPLMLLNNTELEARRAQHGFATVWDVSEVKEIEWVVATKDVTREQAEDGFWFYMAFMLLYNARTLYYTLHYLNDERGVTYETVFRQMVDTLKRSSAPIAGLCRDVVVNRSPSLDGATFGTLFGFPLHGHRAEFDQLLLDFCSQQEWWRHADVRRMVELDLLARPFLFANSNLFGPPQHPLQELEAEIDGRAFITALPATEYAWLARNLEVGALEPGGHRIRIDHARDQLPYMPRKTDEDAGYLLSSLMINVRSVCPQITSADTR